MNEIERGIHPHQVPEPVFLASPDNANSQIITPDHPAREVMTDLRKIKPFQINATASLQEINDKMICCEVRLLFVNDSQGQFCGIITATDILGEKPLLFIQNNAIKREDITAQDLMTPLHKLEAIPFEQIIQSRVSDVITALKDCRRHHMLVIEKRQGKDYVRGIYSVTQVSKQCGIEIIQNERADGFAQLNKALAG